jgi:hypothetical protein
MHVSHIIALALHFITIIYSTAHAHNCYYALICVHLIATVCSLSVARHVVHPLHTTISPYHIIYTSHHCIIDRSMIWLYGDHMHGNGCMPHISMKGINNIATVCYLFCHLIVITFDLFIIITVPTTVQHLTHSTHS